MPGRKERALSAHGRVAADRGGAGASWSARADALMARLLAVRWEADAPLVRADDAGGAVVRFALLFAALRCMVRYVVVPFGLPLLGPAAGWAWGVSVAFDLVAFCGIVLNLRRMWAGRHPMRWRYLAFAAAVLLVGGLLLPGA